MITTFQPTTQPTASTLLATATASKIVTASALALDDDFAVTVEIVAQGLSKLTAAEVDDFAAHGSDPAIAMQIIDAALTDADSDSDTMATISASTLATLPAAASHAAMPPMGASSAEMMVTMIKQIVLPMAERLVELAGRLG